MKIKYLIISVILLLGVGLTVLFYPRKELQKNFNRELKRAIDGNAQSQIWVANEYFNGTQNTSKDFKMFYYWAEKAAAQGIPEAQYKLGAALNSDGKFESAVHWFKNCAENGNGKWQSDALVALSDLSLKGMATGYTSDESFSLITKAALQHNPYACYSLGLLLLSKTGDCKAINSSKALFEDSASNGFIKAKYVLGLLYLKSSCVGKNETKAMELIRDAAEAGDPEAEMTYSKLLDDGIGVAKNQELAHKFKEKAERSGFNGKFLYERLLIE